MVIAGEATCRLGGLRRHQWAGHQAVGGTGRRARRRRVGYGIELGNGGFCNDRALLWELGGSSKTILHDALLNADDDDEIPGLDPVLGISAAEGRNDAATITVAGWDEFTGRGAMWYWESSPPAGGTWRVMFPGVSFQYSPDTVVLGACLDGSGSDAEVRFLYDVNVRQAAVGRADIAGNAMNESELHLVLIVPRESGCGSGDGDVTPDINRDGLVDFQDVLEVLAAWGLCANCAFCPTDLDADRDTSFMDLLSVLSAWSMDCVTFTGPPESVQDCWDRFGQDLAAFEACVESLNTSNQWIDPVLEPAVGDTPRPGLQRDRINGDDTMNQCIDRLAAGIMLAALLPAATTSSAITEFRGVETQAAWESAVGSWQTMDFTGFDAGHHLTDEYEASLGVVFTDTTHQVGGPSDGFPQDGWGLVSGTWATDIEFELATPVMALGLLFPGTVGCKLYDGDELIFETYLGQAGFGNFLGVVSDVPFDRVVIDDGAGVAFVDDIRLGLVVPGPGAVMLLAGAAGIGGGRRRR